MSKNLSVFLHILTCWGHRKNPHPHRQMPLQRMKNQLRKIPELKFYLDDSLDYIETIEKDLSNGKNPIKISSNDEKQRKNKH